MSEHSEHVSTAAKAAVLFLRITQAFIAFVALALFAALFLGDGMNVLAGMFVLLVVGISGVVVLAIELVGVWSLRRRFGGEDGDE
jgi:hypothetical protein